MKISEWQNILGRCYADSNTFYEKTWHDKEENFYKFNNKTYNTKRCSIKITATKIFLLFPSLNNIYEFVTVWCVYASGRKSQFKMHGLNAAEPLAEGYDKQSIMHYGKYVLCLCFHVIL